MIFAHDFVRITPNVLQFNTVDKIIHLYGLGSKNRPTVLFCQCLCELVVSMTS